MYKMLHQQRARICNYIKIMVHQLSVGLSRRQKIIITIILFLDVMDELLILKMEQLNLELILEHGHGIKQMHRNGILLELIKMRKRVLKMEIIELFLHLIIQKGLTLKMHLHKMERILTYIRIQKIGNRFLILLI